MACRRYRCGNLKKTSTALLLHMALIAMVAPTLRAAPYPDRFVWVFGWNLGKDGDVAQINQLLENAAAHGINGAVLSAGMDSMSRQSPDYFRRLGEVNKTCERLKIELIPAVFSVGYGSPALGANRMLAEGVPVREAPFIVSGGEARLVPDQSVTIANGGFEEAAGNRFKGFEFVDQPGQIGFADDQVKHDGKSSLRLENFTANAHGHGRAMQKIRVQPHRCYRLSIWVKTDHLAPTSGFNLLVLAGKGRELAPRQFSIPPTAEWRKITMVFNSMDEEMVNLYAGIWGGREGKLWLDDWTIEEVGPLNVLRRPGTPVTVTSDEGATTFAEGKDYSPLEDSRFSFANIDRPAPPLKLLPGGGIKDGQRLKVSWYHPMVIHQGQVTVCMGEPQLYEIFDREAKALAEHLHPKRVLLNMDEIRMGGTCRACAGRDMGELLGQCITRQVESLRKYIPQCQVYIWSDMLDPNHNAHDNYFLVKGSFAGSWKHVPGDSCMAVWGGKPREKSLRFFADEKFQSLVACYYDADNLNDVKEWLRLSAGLPGVRGFMYTPWQKKYELLGEFGELIRER